MANVIIICGDTGTGKSTSIKSLDPKETFIIGAIRKPLPFKGSNKLYSKENKNIGYSHDSDSIIKKLKDINSNNKDIKNIVLDDIGFVMSEKFFLKAKETGFGKFTEIALEMQTLIKVARDLRDDLNIIFIFHEENEVSNSTAIKKKIKTIGKLLDDQYNPLASVSVALFTDVSYDEKDEPKYQFITNRTVNSVGTIIPAKSPEGMFENLYIPNDLNAVLTKINEYYN